LGIHVQVGGQIGIDRADPIGIDEATPETIDERRRRGDGLVGPQDPRGHPPSINRPQRIEDIELRHDAFVTAQGPQEKPVEPGLEEWGVAGRDEHSVALRDVESATKPFDRPSLGATID